MWLIKMAWKNIWRNKSRTIVTMASIFFAVMLSVLARSLQDGTFNNLVKNVVSFYTGYVQVHQKGYWNEQILDHSFKASNEVERKILSNQNISEVAARIESFALASSTDMTKGSMVIGINPEKENKITLLKNKLLKGHYLKDSDQAVLLSEGLAKRLKLTIKDTLVLIGQGYHGAIAAAKYPVKGIVKFGSPDLNDRSLYLPLPAAQDFYSAYGMATSYILSLKDTKSLQNTRTETQKTLGSSYEVLTWEEMMPDIKQHIEADSNSMKYIQGILYLLICFGIFGTLLMMIVERKFEMGMLVAIGMKKRKLMLLLLFESLFTVITGCLLGILASIPVVYYLNKHPIRIGGEIAKAYEKFGFEALFPTSTEASIFIDQGITVLIIGFILSLYPIYKVMLLNPVNAMKR